MRRALTLGAIAAALAGAGCTRVNPAYCDEDTPCRNGGVCDRERNSCTPGDAGVDGPRGDGPAVPDAGDGGDAGDDGGGDAAPECTQSSACTDPDKPICNNQTCQPCGGDGECLARDSAKPACVSGQCLECGTYLHCTTAGRPLCAADHTCQPCSRDLECKNGPTPNVGVCVAGHCPDGDSVLWVDAAGTDCSTADGSLAKPFCNLVDAKTKAKTDARKTIVVKPGTYGFVALKDAELAGLVVVGLLGGGDVVIQGDTSRPAVDIDLSGAVSLRRLHLKGGGSGSGSTAVLQCSTAACTGEELEIEAGGVGVLASAAQPFTLARCRVHGNAAGGMLVGGSSSYVIVNNFIYSNGTLASSLGGVAFTNSFGTTRFVNNTVYANRAAASATGGLSCDVGTILTRNNILWDNRNGAGLSEVNRSSGTPVCAITYGVIDESDISGTAGAHNTADNPAFVSSVVPPFDLHLTGLSGGALGGADPAQAPSDDIDGNARPAGGPTDIGADQKVP
jgi:hypothetical protein